MISIAPFFKYNNLHNQFNKCSENKNRMDPDGKVILFLGVAVDISSG